MKIRKAVVTAAGLGTRLLPATKAQPKEMLPLVDKPIIQYVVEEAVASGIEQIIIVTGRGKRAIEDHFDIAFELEYFLSQKGNNGALTEMRQISDLADICYIRQKAPLGQGHAILVTKYLVGNEPFAVFFADDVIDNAIPCMKQMMAVYERYKCSVVAVQEVPREAIARYGVVAAQPIDDRIYRVTGFVEKPRPEEAPSNISSLPLYCFSPRILDYLPEVPRSPRGEYELQDAIQMLIERDGRVGGVTCKRRLTLTNAADLLAINRHYLMRTDRPQIAPQTVGLNTQLVTPLRIESGTVIGANSVIGPNVYIERDCRIGDGVTICNAVVLRETVVPDGATVVDQVVS